MLNSHKYIQLQPTETDGKELFEKEVRTLWSGKGDEAKDENGRAGLESVVINLTINTEEDKL